MPVRPAPSVRRRWSLASLAILFILLVAGCTPGKALLVPTVTPTATEARVAALKGEEKDLAVVWKAWTTLLDAYDEQKGIDHPKALEGAVMAMLDAAKVRPYPFLTELPSVEDAPPSEVPDGLEDIWRTWRLLRLRDPETSTRNLASAAASGLADGLNDPHAGFYSPDQYTEMRIEQTAEYQGIGAYVRSIDGKITLYRDPIVGGPAEKVGLKAGDVIVAVDGASIKGFTADQAVRLIRGPEGSEVVLTVERPGTPRTLEVSVFRAKVNLPSLAATEIPGHVHYIYINEFTNDTGRELREALREAQAKGAKALILDLRYNPGGTVTGAVAVASQFLRDGLVMYEVDLENRRRDHSVEDGGLATTLPLAVLVNHASASAAEVVAGAIQDHERGVVFGEQTYGKGSVQIFRELGDGSAMRVTIAHWFTPDGRLIQDKGITPDVAVALTAPRFLLTMPDAKEAALDSQLEAAFSSLLEKQGLSIKDFGRQVQ